MSWLDQVIGSVAPGYALKREQARTDIARHQAVQQVFNQGYGDHGASRRKKSLTAWNPVAGDAEEDIHENLESLRPRARDLYMGGSLANGAIKTMRTSIIGTGLKVKPSFDADFLRLNDDQSRQLRRQIEREFALWADSKDCDAAGMHNFYELQQLAFLSWMMSGDAFVLLPLLPRKHSTYDLRVRLIEADRCNSPLNESLNDKISSGVEVDNDGMVVAYHFSDKHPGSTRLTNTKWTRVEVIGQQSGRRNVLHLMEAERPEQRRGVPLLAPVIESLKQLDRYTEAELMAAVISAMFTVFVETPNPEDADQFGLGSSGDPIDNPTGEPLPPSDGGDLRLGNGAVQFLEPGEKAVFADPSRPNAGFDPFVTAILRQVGASLEIPYELLLKHFTSSYSASRAALLEAWKMFRMRRAWMSADFCQPIYEEWFAEAVIKGRIDAPGIFDDPLLFKAYTKAEWNGPSQGQLDPVKEVNAAVTRIDNGLSTRQREAAELTGTEYESNVRQLVYEQKIRDEYGLATPLPKGGEKEIVEEDQA
ncbi:phage portal protein [Paenibacillus wynnii]|uniref:Portal protein n=1 Tax=Paenibacillus wynnii TaxID=268407 RepID=A0A098MGI1_9BACL|nr:phage portal protein [Paenibacillus wynnii]KGE20647.1 portal protein [Paenibacillus wynnii]KGE20705.1 portal protein [Paenibacillus wynnii]